MTYVSPADVGIEQDYQDHRNRNPPSPEPGTDYRTPYGSAFRIAGDGHVAVVDNSTAGGEGRRLAIDLSDGRRVDYLHLSNISGWVGQPVTRGQLAPALTGSSGNGSDHYYDPHLHVTLREHPWLPYWDSIDFEKYLSPPDERRHIMAYSIVPISGGGGIFLVSLVNGNRVHISDTYHVDLLKRALVNNGGDEMLLPELDIVDSYLNRLDPPPASDPQQQNPLVTPAWAVGFFLGLIGLVEVVRLVWDVLV